MTDNGDLSCAEGGMCWEASPSPKSAVEDFLDRYSRLGQDDRSRVARRAGLLHPALQIEDEQNQDAAGGIAGETELINEFMLGFMLLCGLFMLYMLFVLCRERHRFGKHRALHHGGFLSYLRYRFGYWYTWTPGAAGIVLLVLSLVLLILGGAALHILTGAETGASLWAAWIWIVAPDGGGSAETPLSRAIGMFVSIGGMLLFAMLLSVVASKLEETLASFRRGSAHVVEGGHCVILGWNHTVPTLIDELCIAAESRGGSIIVILTPIPKDEAEDKLVESRVNFRNSTVVVRSGDRTRAEDLAKVALESALRVIVLSKPHVSREDADARTSNVLVTMRTMGWPRQGNVVVQCHLIRNQRLFQHMLSVNTQVIATNDFISQLIVQCSRQRGLASVVKTCFCFDGDEFYITRVAGIARKSFHEVLFGLRDVVLVGFVDQNREVQLVPKMTYVFDGTEELVLLAEDAAMLPTAVSDDLLDASCEVVMAATTRGALSPHEAERQSVYMETIVIHGWNECVGAIMIELDNQLAEGSHIIIYSPMPAHERKNLLDVAQRRRNRRYKNLVVEHREGPLGARLSLEELPLQSTSKVILLADSHCPSPAEADGHTVAAILQVKDILSERVGPVAGPVIVPQILESHTQEACHQLGVHDYIDAPSMSANMLALVAESPQVSGILAEILSESGCKFCLRELRDYLGAAAAESHGLSFKEVKAIAALAGEIALGWSAHGAGNDGPWEMNPKDEDRMRSWTPDTRIVALSPSDECIGRSAMQTDLPQLESGNIEPAVAVEGAAKRPSAERFDEESARKRSRTSADIGVSRLFSTLDSDHDGVITREEFQRALPPPSPLLASPPHVPVTGNAQFKPASPPRQLQSPTLLHSPNIPGGEQVPLASVRLEPLPAPAAPLPSNTPTEVQLPEPIAARLPQIHGAWGSLQPEALPAPAASPARAPQDLQHCEPPSPRAPPSPPTFRPSSLLEHPRVHAASSSQLLHSDVHWRHSQFSGAVSPTIIPPRSGQENLVPLPQSSTWKSEGFAHNVLGGQSRSSMLGVEALTSSQSHLGATEILKRIQELKSQSQHNPVASIGTQAHHDAEHNQKETAMRSHSFITSSAAASLSHAQVRSASPLHRETSARFSSLRNSTSPRNSSRRVSWAMPDAPVPSSPTSVRSAVLSQGEESSCTDTGRQSLLFSALTSARAFTEGERQSANQGTSVMEQRSPTFGFGSPLVVSPLTLPRSVGHPV